MVALHCLIAHTCRFVPSLTLITLSHTLSHTHAFDSTHAHANRTKQNHILLALLAHSPCHAACVSITASQWHLSPLLAPAHQAQSRVSLLHTVDSIKLHPQPQSIALQRSGIERAVIKARLLCVAFLVGSAGTRSRSESGEAPERRRCGFFVLFFLVVE